MDEREEERQRERERENESGRKGRADGGVHVSGT